MPELPEVEITKNKFLKSGLVGRKIFNMRVFSPRQFVSVFGLKKGPGDIKGRKILSISRKGKTVFMELSGSPSQVLHSKTWEGKRALAFHLKMTGNLYVSKDMQANDKHMRFSAELSGGKNLIFSDIRKFGRIWYGPKEKVLEEKYFASLGSDMLNVSGRDFLKEIKKRKGMVKPLLLRQDVFSGIGNIIADEALWLSRIHPRTKVEKLRDGEILGLYKNLKKVIARILKYGGTSMRDWKHPDGKAGEYQKRFLVYSQKTCRRCGSSVKRLFIAGRGSSVCPKCQRKVT